MEWTRRSPCSRGSCPITSPDMGTSAGVVNGASAGTQINHHLRESLANPRVGGRIMSHQSFGHVPISQSSLMSALGR